MNIITIEKGKKLFRAIHVCYECYIKKCLGLKVCEAHTDKKNRIQLCHTLGAVQRTTMVVNLAAMHS